jgi:predicted nucleic acid-binding protein
MYLVESMGGNNAVQELCRQIESGFISLTKPAQETALRACELMRQYADTPMDFADASLVVAAEELGISTILTFDRHFYAYRIDGTTTFDVLP